MKVEILPSGASWPISQASHTVRWAPMLRMLKRWRHERVVAESYDAAAPFYDNWEWQRLWRKTEWPQLRSFLDAPQRVLEIGIGTGAIACRILDENPSIDAYVGIDISPGMLARCRAVLGDRVQLINEDVALVDFATLGGQFDFILSCRMLGHIQMPFDLFSQVKPVLAGDGRFIVTDIDPGHGYTATRLPTNYGRVEVPTFKHNQQDVIAAAERAGLRLDRFLRTYEDEALAEAGDQAPSSLSGRMGPLFNMFVFKQAPQQSV